MNNNFSKAQSIPIDVIQNRPSKHLLHSHGRGKWIRDKELEEFAKKKYLINGRGITIFDVIEEYRCSKRKAQCRLKNACKKKTDKEGKKGQFYFV